MYYQNVRGLRTKLGILSQASTTLADFDIVALTETWLHADISDPELSFPTHNIYRMDRNVNTSQHERGGGVAILVHRSIASICLQNSINFIEHVSVMIKSNSNSQDLIVSAAYFPPNSPAELFNAFVENLEDLAMRYPSSKFIVVGDFNLPDTVWRNGKSQVECEHLNASNMEKLSSSCLLSSVNFLDLFQANDVVNDFGKCLDLLFIPSTDFATKRSLCPIVPCDAYHPALELFFSISENFDTLAASEPKYNFALADYDSMNNELISFDWVSYFSTHSLENSLEYFYNFLYTIIDKHVPMKFVVPNTYPSWYSNQLKKALFEKNVAHKLYKVTRLDADYRAFSDRRRRCKQMESDDYRKFISNIETAIYDDTRSFWKFANEKRGTCGLPNAMFLDDSTVNVGQDIVDLFANFFESIYTSEDVNLYYENNYVNSSVNLGCLTISQCEVFNAIKKLNSKKGPGPDGIPPSLLKNCIANITPMLHMLFSMSLSLGIFPAFWKKAFVTPVFKSGNIHDIRNYRPISILSVIPKLFESIVTDKLTSLVSPVLIDEQYGFRRKRSTVSNLLTFQHYVLEKFEANSQVDAIYTDLAKAFDSVNHDLLVQKLHDIGLHGPFLSWIRSYLTDRIQNVKYRSLVSKDMKVSSGVPQGSHIGPLLFLLFINDVKFSLPSCQILLFADDLKLFAEVKTLEDCGALQESLDALSAWCDSNGLRLNTSKCKIMSYSRSLTPLNFTYSIKDESLEKVTNFKDLGVYFDSKLKFDTHIDHIVNKSLKTLGFIRRMTADFRDSKSICILYSSLVKPVLLYASQIWNPPYAIYSKKLETVQHKFFTFIAWKLQLPSPRLSHDYFQIASVTKLDSLESTRNYNDLLFLFKIINNISECTELFSRIQWRIPSQQLRNRTSRQFAIPHARSTLLYNAPLWRMCRTANTTDIDFDLSYARFAILARDFLFRL